MRFSIVALALASAALASAGLVPRQDSYPDCALPCVQGANYGNCDAANADCLCHNQDFVDSTTQCYLLKCSGADLEQALALARGVCAAVGVTLTSTPALTITTFPPASSATSVSASLTANSASLSGSGSASGSGLGPSAPSGSPSISGSAPSSSGTSAPSGAVATTFSLGALVGALSLGVLAL